MLCVLSYLQGCSADERLRYVCFPPEETEAVGSDYVLQKHSSSVRSRNDAAAEECLNRGCALDDRLLGILTDCTVFLFQSCSVPVMLPYHTLIFFFFYMFLQV